MQKNKEMKDSVKAWQEYSDRHIAKKKTKTEPKLELKSTAVEAPALVRPVPSSPGTIALKTPQSFVPQERSSPTPIPGLSDVIIRPSAQLMTDSGDESNGGVHVEAQVNVGHEERQETTHTVEPREHSSPGLPTEEVPIGMTSSSNKDRDTFVDHLSSDKITSSQTTVPEVLEEDEQITPRAAAPLDDDEEPEFVSERSLKRKRKSTSGIRVFHDGSSDGTPAKPVRVKEELYSSPPPESAVNQLLRKDTMDLDELGPNPIRTPRHRRLRRMNSIHSHVTGTLCNQRSSSAPFSENPIKPERSEAVLMADAAPGFHAAVGAEDSRAASEPGSAIREPREVLRPIDPNVVTGRANEITPHKRVKREEAREGNVFNLLAESGEAPPPSNERKKRLSPNLARAHFNERIRAAKSGLSPMKDSLATPKTAPARTNAGLMPTPPSTSVRPAYTPSARPAQRRTNDPAPRPELIPDGRPIWRMNAPEPSRKPPAPPAPTPKDTASHDTTRLRDKPLSELRLQDFKPNPAYNGGYTHAFTSTVRRREDRLCLPGCTKPTCCGSTFRTLALAAAPLPASQEEALLQDYLGDAYSSFGLSQMDKAEREEIVLQARTRKMATEHGKHRAVYEGRKTPPGFWRVDFPDTQEREEDRERAVRMGVEEVRERWLQAMRRGGRFVFADE